ncbi:septum site-determining protein MinC [Methyloversatilis discipulorum]|uniref:septum site-determining protein MinC n=1 Tax=Methyloversatilis discipulorum TaxID=1119528 RepID=UPI001A4C43BB|nr:septum site-determining protein MinC [Methyloversatilis discipulorum]MBL8466984.1 septum site-determining protein MinC [Methyloversatilis discipulorum]
MARKPDTSAIELKSATLEAMRAVLRSNDSAAIAAALDARLGGMPGFFSGEPVVIDCSELPADARPDLPAIRDALGRHALTAVAVQAACDAAADDARTLGMAVLAADSAPRSASTPAPEPVPTPEISAPAPAPAPEPVAAALPEAMVTQAQRRTEIIDKPLRSGQRIYARGCDLVVLAMVSAGAEVIADGNIHIYAPLRGRALAGASGDTEARIFTTCFEAELVSIAGVYRTFEHTASGELLRRPAHVRLEDHSDKQVLTVAALATT